MRKGGAMRPPKRDFAVCVIIKSSNLKVMTVSIRKGAFK